MSYFYAFRRHVKVLDVQAAAGLVHALGALDARRRFMIETIVPRADRVFVLNPELAHFVPGSVFLPYCSVDVEARPISQTTRTASW